METVLQAADDTQRMPLGMGTVTCLATTAQAAVQGAAGCYAMHVGHNVLATSIGAGHQMCIAALPASVAISKHKRSMMAMSKRAVLCKTL